MQRGMPTDMQRRAKQAHLLSNERWEHLQLVGAKVKHAEHAALRLVAAQGSWFYPAVLRAWTCSDDANSSYAFTAKSWCQSWLMVVLQSQAIYKPNTHHHGRALPQSRCRSPRLAV